jgi:D-amino-acid dehydrogenase
MREAALAGRDGVFEVNGGTDWCASKVSPSHSACTTIKSGSLQRWQLSGTEVAVVGAGIIGLSVAYHLVQAGASVTVIDRDPEGDKASFGNAGAIAVTEVVPASVPGVVWKAIGWIVDPLGPVTIRLTHASKMIPWLTRFAKMGTPDEVDRISRALAALNSRVYEDLLPMLKNTGFAGDLRRNGALTVYETDDGYRRDALEWKCKRERGIVVQEMTAAEARDLESALGPRVRRAVFTPQWSHVSDPRRLIYLIRNWLLSRGVVIRRGEVQDIVPTSSSEVSLKLEGGAFMLAARAVIAAGVWSATLARRLGDRVLLESERGYNTTIPNPGISVERQLIFAERKFVATPLSCGLRIGGAAEFGGVDALPNFKRSRILLDLARYYLPALQTDGGTAWAGHRPATPDSLPIIGASKCQSNVFYAFGHGHLGLTHAATTGRLVSDLVMQNKPLLDLSPYRASRFD